jgi:hypothetical protein
MAASTWAVEHAANIRFAIETAGILTAQVVAVVSLFKVKELHVIVNNRLSQLIELNKRDSFSQGRLEGVTAQQDRGDKLAALAVIESDKGTHATSQPIQVTLAPVDVAPAAVQQTVEHQVVQKQTINGTSSK